MTEDKLKQLTELVSRAEALHSAKRNLAILLEGDSDYIQMASGDLSAVGFRGEPSKVIRRHLTEALKVLNQEFDNLDCDGSGDVV